MLNSVTNNALPSCVVIHPITILPAKPDVGPVIPLADDFNGHRCCV